MVKQKFLVALAAGLACVSGAAGAATLVVNCTVLGASGGELVGTLTCNQFNVAGATLQSVQIQMTGQIAGSLVLQNNGSATQTGTDTTSSDFSAGPLAGFSIVNPLFTPSYTTGPQNVLAGQTITFSGLIASLSSSLGTNTVNLVPYIGAGTFAIPVSTTTNFVSVMTGGLFDVQQIGTSESATAAVTYTYLPAGTLPVTGIPTLSEWGLLVLAAILGLAAMAGLRRRLPK